MNTLEFANLRSPYDQQMKNYLYAGAEFDGGMIDNIARFIQSFLSVESISLKFFVKPYGCYRITY